MGYMSDNITPWQFIQNCPTYTEVRFSTHGSKICDGIVRDIPGRDTRRITNTTTGMEFFVDADVLFDTFAITGFPREDSPASWDVEGILAGILDPVEAEALARRVVSAVRVADATSQIEMGC